MRLALMDDLFDSAWLKWAQAVVNAEVLQVNLNELAGQGILQVPIGMTCEYHPKSHCVVITAGPENVPRIFPVHMGLLLGDIVHNFRASLDHLAWAIYKRGKTPALTEWREQGVYFPITRSNDAFNEALVATPKKRSKLPGVRRADIAIARRYQPYKYGKRNLDNHCFVVLDKLANADKHRTIQPVQAVPEKAAFQLLDVRGCKITRLIPRQRRAPLEPGTELVRFYVRKSSRNAEPEIDVEPHFTVDPTIDGRIKFQDWGYVTIRVIAKLLGEFEGPPEIVPTLLGGTSHGTSPRWLPEPRG
jgi:hypothetical protein